MNYQEKALIIESILKKYKLDMNNEASIIRDNPIKSLEDCFVYIGAKFPEKSVDLNCFISDYIKYKDMSLDEFESKGLLIDDFIKRLKNVLREVE